MNLRAVRVTLAFVSVLGMAHTVFARPAARPQQPFGHEQAIYLIRSTLLTLNDADRSGNYTVFRDLASPAFQAANTDADIAGAFTDLRRRRVDLSVVAVLMPHLTAAPAVDEPGVLKLSGFFPTQPLRIKFDLKFQDVSGKWRLMAISVATPKAPPTKIQSSASDRER